MALTKLQREKVRAKSDGHCWYCGCELPERGWHVDHFEPIRRFENLEITEEGPRTFMDCENPHLDTIENWVPACKPCNLFKGVYKLEDFRMQIQAQVERARAYSVNFRTAERFGLIKESLGPVVFWFEAQGL